MTLRVLLDATAIPADRGGVGRYLDGVVPALVRQGVDLHVACLDRDADGFAASGATPLAVLRDGVSRPTRAAWEQTRLPRLVSRVGAQVLHSPHYTMPAVRRVPTVVTLHDATFFSLPDVHVPLKRTVFRAAISSAVRLADALVVPSAATRDEVLRYAGGDPARFHVAYHGVDRDTFFPPSPEACRALADDLGLGGTRYVAFLGTLEPRKNVPALVRAWTMVASQFDAPPALVLAGARGWDTQLDAVRRDVPAGLRLVVPGYLPIEQLAPLLGGADVVAYPALGEGFGLPVLEAMASAGCVLTTRELSLPEVGGDAVAYSGTSSGEIAAVLRDLLADDARRADLSRAAVERSAMFTWDASARRHVEAYVAAVGRRR